MEGEPGSLHGWLKKAGTKGLNTNAFKKKYFRQLNNELHYYENDKCEESQGFINLADVINLFVDGKSKQGIFVLLTQSRAWKLQGVGDDLDVVRAQWMKALEIWLNDNRPGFKKLKKMGFEKPTVVQGLIPGSSPKRSSVSDVSRENNVVSAPFKVSDDGSGGDLPKDDQDQKFGLRTMKATALNYRRLELQIKMAQDSIGTSAGNTELFARVKKLEEEREEKRAAAALREFQLSELEKDYAEAANVSRADFQSLLKRVAEFQQRLLKPGFEKIQSVFESLQAGEDPVLSKDEIADLLRSFEAVLPTAEAALHMSTTLLQKDRANIMSRVTALESENKMLQETIDDLDQKKAEVLVSSEYLCEISAQIKQTAEVFPTISFTKNDAVEWLKSPPEDGDEIMRAVNAAAGILDARGEEAGTESLKLILMEKLSDTSSSLVLAEDGSIKAATVDMLFSMLINGEGRVKHPEFEDAVLFGFPSFAQPMDLLEKIVLCFCSTLPSSFEGPRPRAEAIIEMNRKRLLGIVKKWMLYHEDHFREKSFARFLQDFIVTVELSGLKEEAQRLRDVVSSNIFPFQGESVASILPPDLSEFILLDLSPVEVARQMTRLDAALFELIETRDFLETAWTSKNANVATSVKAITKQFNRMSQWVASMILQEEDLRRRAQVIEFFVATAEACLQINNFNGLLQIMGSLSKTEIHRLTNSWELVSKEKMKLMESHRDLLQSNCSLLRQRYAAAKPPCLPYLGTYLTDLVMIGEQKTRIGDKVNYRKLQLQEKCLSALMRRNEDGIKFGFREVKEIRSMILDDSMVYKTDDELMKRSLELEPRAAEGGTARIVKSKSMAVLMRADTKSRGVVRKGNPDRSTVQLTTSRTAETPPFQRKTSSTVGASQGVLPVVAPDGRSPPPTSSPSLSGRESPRDRAGSPSGLSSSVPALSESSSSFRSVRSTMRVSSPVLPSATPVTSPMIGKRVGGSSMRASGVSDGGHSIQPSSPDSSSPRAKVSIPAAKESRVSISGLPVVKGPVPRKALPKPPRGDGSAESDEEEEDNEDL